MGLNLSDLGPVYIVCGKTDLRKGIDSLAYLIQSQFALDPFSKSVFLFCGGKNDRFKALYWDGGKRPITRYIENLQSPLIFSTYSG